MKRGQSGRRNEALERKFCQEYVLDHNGTQAAIRAGYSKRSASTLASRLLDKVEVQQQIDKLENAIAERTGLTAALVREEYRRVITFNAKMLFDERGDRIPIHELPDEVAACIASVQYETVVVKCADGSTKPIECVKKVYIVNKNQALSDAARITGLMKDTTPIDINPLVELLQRISGNGSGLPLNNAPPR